MDAQDILDELERDDRIPRVQALASEIEDATGLDLPSSRAALEQYKGTITRKLREEAGHYDEEDGE